MSGRRIFVLVDALGWATTEEHNFACQALPNRRPLGTVLGFNNSDWSCHIGAIYFCLEAIWREPAQ